MYGSTKFMQAELGPAVTGYRASHKGATTACAYLGHELISFVTLPPTPSLASSLSLLDCELLTICVCFCLHPGVCHVWTVPSAATGANTATCVPMTPPAAPSRRDESTPLRLVVHSHAQEDEFSVPVFSPHTEPVSVSFCLHCCLCCSSLSASGHVFWKTAIESSLFFQNAASHSELLFSATPINSPLSPERLSLTSLNNVTLTMSVMWDGSSLNTPGCLW